MARDYTQLKIWQNAHGLTLKIYRLASEFPNDEKYGLISQIRRAASSIGANIVEACGQSSYAAVRRFLLIAYGSAKELSYHLLLAKDLGYFSDGMYEELSKELSSLSRMTYSFIAKMPKTTCHPEPPTCNPI